MTLASIVGPIFFILTIVGGIAGLVALLGGDLFVQSALKSTKKTD